MTHWNRGEAMVSRMPSGDPVAAGRSRTGVSSSAQHYQLEGLEVASSLIDSEDGCKVAQQWYSGARVALLDAGCQTTPQEKKTVTKGSACAGPSWPRWEDTMVVSLVDYDEDSLGEGVVHDGEQPVEAQVRIRARDSANACHVVCC
ncbi:hypothetical protein NDU88_006900 [Pleurodeles waltl]|uniref:Uncharacterized protein n=1 Tax=Pleurodeles waltl TaxID=8319 RepID=A0AAV7MDK9_PLEWA|nr:hypothetical protein NDU88_006900 [Pleurodeles waltl]